MGHGVPELVLELNGRTWTLDASRPYTLGRDPQGDVVLDDARVSWRHATISWGGRSWVIEDHGSTNGTFVQGQRIHQMEIGPGSAVHLGNATDGPRVNLSGSAAAVAAPQQAQPQQQPYASQGAAPGWAQQAPPQQQAPQQSWPQSPQAAASVPQQQGPGGGAGAPPVYGDRSPTTFHQFSLGRVMRIGRALENELVVSDLQVSRHHAEFHATPDGRYEIRDLGSHNGTYVNGQPITKGGSALLGANDIVGVGHSTFRLIGDRLEEFVDTGEVSFSARRLTVRV
ncbi:MAG: transport system ATP-binding/permease protein, partial [Streptomyces sp.]|nr:transport system ATP-binding/permease protein [Streptomyces sp.]